MANNKNTIKDEEKKNLIAPALAPAAKNIDTSSLKGNVNVGNVEKEKEKSNILGVDDDTYNDSFNNKFSQSIDSVAATDKAKKNLSNLESLVGGQIISDDVMSALGSQFVVPEAVTEADAYLSQQLEKIQSGKTTYSDQVRDMMDKIMNRDKFSYDVDNDQLFQQALASAMNSGKQAMQDTIGQASALTGGYGSTYATTAANQTYNAFIEDAYDNLPQYYQMAMEAYQMEGDEMYRQFGMLSELDDKEFNRNVTAYDATYQHRNQMYNEAYTQFRDNKNDAFNMANLQLNEHGQRVSDATNLYNATSDYADKMYEREYNSWLDSVNMAMKKAEFLNSDAWANKNFDESVRQYEKNYSQTEDHFTRNQEFQDEWNQKNFDEGVRQYNTSLAEQKRQFDATMAQRAASGGGGGSGGGYYGGGGGTEVSESANTKAFNTSIMSRTEFEQRGKKASINGKTQVYDTYQQYVDDKIGQWDKAGNLTENDIAYLVKYHFS